MKMPLLGLSTSALLLLGSLLNLLSSAYMGSPPPACNTNADCAYAGSCIAGHCHCRSPYKGPRCSALGLAPMEPDSGLRLKQNWTWGGSVIRGEDGQYHMFVMHLVEHCPYKSLPPTANQRQLLQSCSALASPIPRLLLLLL